MTTIGDARLRSSRPRRFAMTVHIEAEPHDVQQFYDSERPAAALIHGELSSWLESLAYVRKFTVQRNA